MGIRPCVSLATWRPVRGQHHSLVLGFGDAPVPDQAPGIQLNLDLVLGLAHLHAPMKGLSTRAERFAFPIACATN
jgi:hypothetical protein